MTVVHWYRPAQGFPHGDRDRSRVRRGRHDQAASGPLDTAGVVELGGPVARASLGD